MTLLQLLVPAFQYFCAPCSAPNTILIETLQKSIILSNGVSYEIVIRAQFNMVSKYVSQ